MTGIGRYLSRKSVNKADISRKTGISTSRLSLLSRKGSAQLKAEELYLIALAIDVKPSEILSEIFKDLKLKNNLQVQNVDNK